MSKQGVDYLVEEANKAINYCRQEFDMSYAEMVGAFTCVVHGLLKEATEDDEEEQDDYKTS